MINITYHPDMDISLIQDEIQYYYTPTGNDPERRVQNKKNAKKILNRYSKIQIDPQDPFILDLINFIKTERELVEQDFYDKIWNFFEIKITQAPDITCYLTRADHCPYSFNHPTTIQEKAYCEEKKNQNSEQRFACSMSGWALRTIFTIMHELTHYFQPEIMPSRDIKEAIAIILNDNTTFQQYRNGVELWKWRTPWEWKRQKIIRDLYLNGWKFSDLKKLINESTDADYHLNKWGGSKKIEEV